MKEIAEKERGSYVQRLLELARRYFVTTGETSATDTELLRFEQEERLLSEGKVSEWAEMKKTREAKKRLKDVGLSVYYKKLRDKIPSK